MQFKGRTALVTGSTSGIGLGIAHALAKEGANVVINGFGKSAGLVQVAELGTLETPILLTNTFGVGTCANALIRRAIAVHDVLDRERR